MSDNEIMSDNGMAHGDGSGMAADAHMLSGFFAENVLAKHAGQAAHDQELARMLESVRLRIEDLEDLCSAAQAVAGVIGLQDVLELCCQIIAGRVECRCVTVAAYEQAENTVNIMTRLHPEGGETNLLWLRQTPRPGLICRVAQSRKSILATGIGQSAVMNAQEKGLWPEGSLLAVPILHNNSAVAVAVLHRMPEDTEFSPGDLKATVMLASAVGPAIYAAKIHYRQRCQMYAALQTASSILEGCHPFLKGHPKRVLAYGQMIGSIMEIMPCDVGALQIAASLCDLGMIGVPEDVLGKCEELTPDEWAAVRQHTAITMAHTQAAAKILEQVECLSEVAAIIRAHHERWDGTGYPDGLMGEQIPLLARIIAVADAFDSMTTKRPHREALSIEDALKRIRDSSGQQFCPQAVAAFMQVPVEALAEIRDSRL